MEIKEIIWRLIDDWYFGSWLYTQLIVFMIVEQYPCISSPSMISFYVQYKPPILPMTLSTPIRMAIN
jgi:hypothetical protein